MLRSAKHFICILKLYILGFNFDYFSQTSILISDCRSDCKLFVFFSTKVTLDIYSAGCEAHFEKVSKPHLCTYLVAAGFRLCRAILHLTQDLVYDDCTLVSHNCSQQRSLVSSTSSARALRSGQVSEFQAHGCFPHLCTQGLLFSTCLHGGEFQMRHGVGGLVLQRQKFIILMLLLT